MKYLSSNILQRILDKFRPLQIFDDGESDRDLRNILAHAMSKIDPAFDWICEVYQESGAFIYSTYVIMGGSYEGVMKYFRRTYSLSEGGKEATINDDAVEVRPRQVWETVGEGAGNILSDSENPTVAESTAASKPCSCHEKKSNQLRLESSPEDNKEKIMEKKDETVIPPATTAAPTVAPVVASVATPTPQQPSQPLTLTEAQALEACPSLKPLIDGYRAQQAKRKTALVSLLSASQTKLGKEVLEAKTVEQLEEYASLLGLEGEGEVAVQTQTVDYSLLGAQQTQTQIGAANKEWRKLPDPWGLGKKAAG